MSIVTIPPTAIDRDLAAELAASRILFDLSETMCDLAHHRHHRAHYDYYRRAEGPESPACRYHLAQVLDTERRILRRENFELTASDHGDDERRARHGE